MLCHGPDLNALSSDSQAELRSHNAAGASCRRQFAGSNLIFHSTEEAVLYLLLFILYTDNSKAGNLFKHFKSSRTDFPTLQLSTGCIGNTDA